MRTVRIALFAVLAICSVSTAWAQYGLYGSPETLQLPQQETTQAYSAPASYPTTATPMPQPAPQYYSPQPQYRYPATAAYRPAQPQYRYPAQPQATAAYQPYQPGAQYRYPGPSYATRPPLRTAAVEQPAVQPIPPPPGMPGVVAAPSEVPPPQNAGMMNQVLADQNCGCGYGCDNGCGGAYRGALGQFEQAACGPQAGGCGYDGCGYYCPWYASVSALVMGRSDGRRLWTSYQDQHLENQLTNTQFGLQWKWGGEARIGRRFCCGCVPYALEATYWTTEAFSGYRTTSLYPGGYVSTPLVVRYLEFGPGCGADDWFDGARSHRLVRNDEFHNFEINLVREQLAWACDSPWDIGWSVGVRYFRFQDMLTFSTISHDGDGDAYLSDVVNNNLIGAQFGFDAAYNLTNGLRLFITPKVGIYDNFLDSTFQAKGRIGSGAYIDGSSTMGTFPAHGSRSGVSFLTQVDVGADWQFSRNWSARVGYRVVAVTGVGLADDQFPQYINDVPEIQNVQHTSSLVLHGAFFGATYNF